MRKRNRVRPDDPVPHMDILMSLESMIQSIYQQEPDLMDFEVKKAVEALTRHYKAVERGRRPPTIRLTGNAENIREVLELICEWQLGNKSTDSGLPAINDPVTANVIVKCLRRIKKSIDLWTKQGGRQGYLNYVSHFLNPGS